MTIHTQLFGYSFVIDKEKLVAYEDPEEKKQVFKIKFGKLTNEKIAKKLQDWFQKQGMRLEPEEMDLLITLVRLREKVGGNEYLMELKKIEEREAQLKIKKKHILREGYTKISIVYMLPYTDEDFSRLIDAIRNTRPERMISFDYIGGLKTKEVLLGCSDDTFYDIVSVHTSKLEDKEVLSTISESSFVIAVFDAKASSELLRLVTEHNIGIIKEVVLISLGWNPLVEKTKKNLFKKDIPYGLYICSDYECIFEKLVRVLSRIVCVASDEIKTIKL